MGHLIDSSILIAAERGLLDLTAAMKDHGSERLFLSAVTASELLHGVHRASGATRARRERYVEALFERLRVLAFDLRCARIHGQIHAELKASGTMIGTHDAMIAATAVANDCAVVTRDLRSFGRIRDLTVLHW